MHFLKVQEDFADSCHCFQTNYPLPVKPLWKFRKLGDEGPLHIQRGGGIFRGNSCRGKIFWEAFYGEKISLITRNSGIYRSASPTIKRQKKRQRKVSPSTEKKAVFKVEGTRGSPPPQHQARHGGKEPDHNALEFKVCQKLQLTRIPSQEFL